MASRRWILVSTAAIAVVFVWLGTTQSADKGPTDDIKVTPRTIKWTTGPASLPPGCQVAILEGDLTKGEAYTLRLKVPDGYQVAPHWHPMNEHLTVLEGTLMMGHGPKFDKSMAFELPTGSFYVLPKGEKHFVWARGETIVQLHGVGPWGINYVNPSDDPRNSRK